MNISQVPDRDPRDAALLQLGIRMKYAAESWAGTKPFLTGSLNGHPESGETPGPDIDWRTALGIKCLWATAAFARQHPLLAAAYRFSGLRAVANAGHGAMYRRVLDRCAEAPTPRRDMPIPEFDWQNESPESFREQYIDHPHPVVLRGFAADSEAARTWTFEGILDRFGDEDVLLTTGELDGEPGKLDAVKSDKVYLHNCEMLFRRHPEMVDDVPLEAMVPYCGMRPTHLQLFVGRKGTGSPFHSAGTWNWFFNLHGRKQWWFIDPRHGYLNYPLNAMGQVASFSLCPWPDDYDREYFPAFAHCPIFTVTLEPGDVLLNPPWWWHAVRNVSETSVAVASRWIREGRVGSDLRTTEHDYDIDRMRSWLFFAGASGWPFLHRMLKNPSPTVAPDVTEREKRGRFTHLQRKLSTEKVFGMRHRF